MEVIILAGGLGTRLRSVVQEVPKCMAPVGGRPFLAYILDWLKMYPIDHVVFSVGYLKERIIEYIGGKQWPFTYDFALEETPLGTVTFQSLHPSTRNLPRTGLTETIL